MISNSENNTSISPINPALENSLKKEPFADFRPALIPKDKFVKKSATMFSTIQKEQGILGKLWDKTKNLLGMKNGSDKIKK